MPIPLLFSSRFSGIALVFTAGMIALLVYWGIFPLNTSVILPIIFIIALFGFVMWIRRENR